MALAAGEQEFLFTLPLDAVVRGRFYASIGLYCPGEGRQLRQLDHVTRAFTFEVTPPGDGPVWSSDAYGHILLPEMQGVRL